MNLKLILFALTVSFISLSCNSSSKNDLIKTTENDSISSINQEERNNNDIQASEPQLEQKSANSTSETDIEQLKTEAARLNGGGSIKTVELKNGKAVITYVKNYKEYKKLNPQSRLTENDLKSYWSTRNEIQKTLVGSPARLMKKLDFINEIKIILPFENKIYKIDVKKSELEKFVGKSISEIENDWIKSFADPYIYDKKGREIFFKKFGETKNN